MRLGMTGSRTGMNDSQRAQLHAWLEQNLSVTEAHHGDCVGADAQFHQIVTDLGINVIVHPPDVSGCRAYCHSHDVRAPRPFLERNRDIVDSSDVLLAFPATKHEELRSGTWSTVRYARKMNKPVHVFYP